MKKKELMQMSKSELTHHLGELEKELMKIRVQLSSGASIKSPGQVRKIKKTIARIKTALHNGEQAVKKKTKELNE